MVEEQKDVTVSINVPEYEKENVILSAQGRSIKIAWPGNSQTSSPVMTEAQYVPQKASSIAAS